MDDPLLYGLGAFGVGMKLLVRDIVDELELFISSREKVLPVFLLIFLSVKKKYLNNAKTVSNNN